MFRCPNVPLHRYNKVRLGEKSGGGLMVHRDRSWHSGDGVHQYHQAV
jgi:hypothetical protein